MPPNQQTPASLEETMMLEEVYGKAIDRLAANPVLEKSGWIKTTQTDTRKALERLLGGEAVYNAVVGAKEKIVTPDVRQRVIAHMIQTNTGIHNILKGAIKEPKDVTVTLAGGRTDKLSNLIRDPNSEDARALAWYYQNVATSTEKEFAFNHIDNPADAKKILALMKARRAYDAIVADDANVNIGKPGTPGTGTELKKIEDRLAKAVKAQSDAEKDKARTLTAKPDANVSHYEAKIERADTAIADLEEKKGALEKKHKDLKTKIESLTKDMTDFAKVTFTSAQLDALASDFDKDKFNAALNAAHGKIPLAGRSYDLGDYLSDEKTRAWSDRLHEMATRNGTGKPTANDVLKNVVNAEYRGIVSDETQRDQLFHTLKKVHQGTGAQASAAIRPGTAASGPNSTQGSSAVDRFLSKNPIIGGMVSGGKSFLKKDNSLFHGSLRLLTWPFRATWNKSKKKYGDWTKKGSSFIGYTRKD